MIQLAYILIDHFYGKQPENDSEKERMQALVRITSQATLGMPSAVPSSVGSVLLSLAAASVAPVSTNPLPPRYLFMQTHSCSYHVTSPPQLLICMLGMPKWHTWIGHLRRFITCGTLYCVSFLSYSPFSDQFEHHKCYRTLSISNFCLN